MIVSLAKRGWSLACSNSLARSFGKKQVQPKEPKEKKFGIAVTDEKMIKLTTKEDSKAAEQLRVDSLLPDSKKWRLKFTNACLM